MENKKTAILLVNLGSPEQPSTASTKQYLRQFLNDPRIVETANWAQKLFWKMLLHGVILNTRPKQSALKYKSIWLENGSPLLLHTQACAKKLAQKFENFPVVVDFAMRYGQPSIAQKLAHLQKQGVNRILVVPMYAQYSATTIGSVMDEIARYFLQTRHLPHIRSLYGWHNHPAYITALTHSIENALTTTANAQNIHLILSFHGIPQKYAQQGDPYPEECLVSAQLLKQALQSTLEAKRIHLSFQSRFGPSAWLQPYTIDLLKTFPQKGIRDVALICPGFCVDCLETLEEINILGRNTFLQNGGQNFIYIPALNAEDFWIQSLSTIIEPELMGWI